MTSDGLSNDRMMSGGIQSVVDCRFPEDAKESMGQDRNMASAVSKRRRWGGWSTGIRKKREGGGK